MIDPELESLWRDADARVHAPRGFEDRLFARLAAEKPVRALAPAREAMPWWVRAAGERHVALAFAIMGVLFAAPMSWLRFGATLESAARAGVVALAPWVAPLAKTPNAGFAVALACAPAVAWASYRLALALERKTARAALRVRA